MYQYQVSFGEAIKRAFSKYCCFTGRASRSEFWWWRLFLGIISFVLNILSSVFMAGAITAGSTGMGAGSLIISILMIIFGLVCFLPDLGLTFRRLHDAGHSGWNILWNLLPIIGQIILLVYFCQQSQPMENKYGPVPNMTDGNYAYS